MTTNNAANVGLFGASGTGAFAGTDSPTFTTPVLGDASASTLNKVSITAPATGATLTIDDAKTLTVENSLIFQGVDGSTVDFGAGGTVSYGGGGGVTAAQVQQSAFNYGADSGVADAYAVTLSPAISSYTDGLLVSFLAQNQNLTINPTLDVNGMGPIAISIANTPSGGNPAIGDLNGNFPSYLIYSSFLGFVLLNPAVSTPTSGQVQHNFFNNGPDSGAADVYLVTLTPTLVGSYYTGMPVAFIASNSNATTTPTLEVADGGGPLTIYRPGYLPLQAGDIVSGKLVYVVSDPVNAAWILLNPANPAAAGAGGSDTQIQYNNSGVLDGDPNFTTDAAGNLTAVSLAWSDTTKGLVGTTTNDSAGAGFVGQYVESVVNTNLAIGNNSVTNLTQLTLPSAGDWDVFGQVIFISGSTTVLKQINSWISDTSGSFPSDFSTVQAIDYGSTGVSNVGVGVTSGNALATRRFSVAGSTTIYLGNLALFTTSNLDMQGFLAARRVR